MRNAFWKWLLAVPLLAALVVPVVGWQIEARKAQRGWSQHKARNQDRPIPVRTAVVMQGDGVDVIGATSVTMPYATAPVMIDTASAEVSNRLLTKVHVAEGDVVKQGDPLFEFDPSLFQQKLEHTDANIVMVQDQVHNIGKILKEGAASKVELSMAEADLEAAKLSRKVAALDLEQSVVRSPLDGVVGTVNATAGVRVPDMTEMTIVYQLDPILVRVDFPLERLGSVAVGKQAEVTLDSFPDETHYGTVTRISANALPQTRVLHVYVELPNKDLRLRGGITGFTRLTSQKQAVTVPRNAVVRRKGRAMVFRVENGVARMTEIQTGAMVRDGHLELLAGLKPGDEVVIFGQDELRDGDRVDTDWKRWANRTDGEQNSEPDDGLDESGPDESGLDENDPKLDGGGLEASVDGATGEDTEEAAGPTAAADSLSTAAEADDAARQEADRQDTDRQDAEAETLTPAQTPSESPDTDPADDA